MTSWPVGGSTCREWLIITLLLAAFMLLVLRSSQALCRGALQNLALPLRSSSGAASTASLSKRSVDVGAVSMGTVPAFSASSAIPPRRPWREVEDIRERLQLFTSGIWVDDGSHDAPQALAEYRLINGTAASMLARGAAAASEIKGAGNNSRMYFLDLDQRLIQRCLAGRWLLFIGDSRIRYLFSSLIAGLAGSFLPADCPMHRACPYGNTPRVKVEACSEYYTGSHSCYDFHFGGARVTYLLSRWAKQSLESKMKRFPGSKGAFPDIVFVNNGAWMRFHEAWPESLKSAPPLGPESDEDRLTFFGNLTEYLRPAGVLKVAVGYPSCRGDRVNYYNLMDPLRETLFREGWVVYDAGHVTSAQVWGRRAYGRAWSRDLLPQEVLPHEAKAEQCKGSHVFDTLADLEIRILLNSICVAEA